MLFTIPVTALFETVQAKPTQNLNSDVSDPEKAYDTGTTYLNTYGTWNSSTSAYFYRFSFDIPADAAITDIAVYITGRRHGSNNSSIQISVSNDGGSSYSDSADYNFENNTMTLSQSGLWEKVWTPTHFNTEDNFGILVTAAEYTTRIYDIRVAVTYSYTDNYTVTWINGDDILESDTAPYGSMPSYDGALPEKAGTPEITYTFAGWSTEAGGPVLETLPAVTGNTVYYAVFTAETNTYTVTWVNGEETLETDTVSYGSLPYYDGAVPQKAGTAESAYIFAGWSAEAGGAVLETLPPVTGNTVYYAVFTAESNTYTVIWVNGDQLLETDIVTYGSRPSYDGISPVQPASPQFSFQFIGWSAANGGPVATELPAITGNVTYYAVFTAIIREFTVTWLNHDGTLLQRYMSVPYGVTPVYTGAMPERTPDGSNIYTFIGWSLLNSNDIITDLPAVIRDTTYRAVFKSLFKPELNSIDHNAYIIGYPDGTVRPNSYITREEAAKLVYRLLTEKSIVDYKSDVNSFSDMHKERWSNTAISTLYNAGILKGDPDGSLRPGENITRAEAISLAAFFADPAKNRSVPLSDINGHWAQNAIQLAAGNGWIEGYTDGSFRPDQFITRAEIIALFNRILNRKVNQAEDLLPGMKVWLDNTDTAEWYYFDIQEATNSHHFERKHNGFEKWTELK